MTRYREDSRDRVRDAVDLVELVSRRTELRRKGADSWFGLCPFHDERTPSFHVRPGEGHYYCFGCQASGDAFSFVMETEGVDFVGALELLAARCGVTLEAADDDPAAVARRARRGRLLALLDRATSWYARCLWEAEEAGGARAYLAGRGLAPETLRAFRVGYAPSGWDRLLAASRAAGFADDELLAAGLAQRGRRSPERLLDRFRERIVFPLCDLRGHPLGFGARAMGADQQPKYLNSSENELFHKGHELFGADRARAAAARAGQVVVVEGYTDVLALHQAGVERAVAIMGTALTEHQVAELRRLAPVAALALDADRAGQAAMLRAARVAARKSLELRVVALDEGADPADLVLREGAEAIRARMARSAPFVEFQVDRILAAADTTSAEGRDGALAQLRPVLAELAPSALREELVRRTAARLGLSEALVASLGGSAAPAPGAAPAEHRAGAALDRREDTERAFLALCIALPEQGREALGRLRPEQHFTGPLARRAARWLCEADRLGDPLAHAPGDDPELAGLLGELVARFSHVPVSPGTLELETLQLDRARLDRELAAARRSQPLHVAELAAERNEVRQRIAVVSEQIDRVAG